MKLVQCILFEFSRTFLKILVMFGNENVCAIVLIMSDSTDYVLLKFSWSVSTIFMGCKRIE